MSPRTFQIIERMFHPCHELASSLPVGPYLEAQVHLFGQVTSPTVSMIALKLMLHLLSGSECRIDPIVRPIRY